ncbi:WAS/WASL-interacting protein family member 3-like [Cydia pomonella]|uniref:WAS/WASL-interacting protein family member 3-like n=1 Tax=Cydia pomonella TaxID=82600 RepID=UPI002ADD6D70|nr:WAS/WASL-interacting protein family member 3-like [Cydia pomonella]
MAEGSSGNSHIKPISPEALHPCAKKPIPEKGDIVKLKICDLPPDPEPILPTPCQIQIREQKLKAGVIFCPKPPPEPHPPIPDCSAICIEKVKNLPVFVPKKEVLPKCPMQRVETGFARCNRIRDATAAKEDLPWPGCPPEPPPPPPKIPTPCDIQKKEQALARCKAKYAHYYPPKKH